MRFCYRQFWGAVHPIRWRVAGLMITVCAASGCVPPQAMTNTDFTDGNLDDTLTSPKGKTSGEPNDTFATAVVAVFDRDSRADLVGTVSGEGDIDVFLLGSLARGDRVMVGTNTSSSALDISIALFDGLGRLVFENDDDAETGSFDSSMDFVIRHSSDAYYVAVSHAAFAAEGRRSGTYKVDIEIEADQPVTEPSGQIVVLDFDGGTVTAPILVDSLGSMTVGPFDAEDISRMYAGQTQAMKETIIEVTQQNFARFDVTVVSSDDALPADPSTYTSILIGGLSDEAFGIAESVDLYNLNICDDALVFAESFSPAFIGQVPSDVAAIAIANVASHEAGHLLGLNHVDDPDALMDAASPANFLFDDQEFIEAPLSSDIMRLGTQDSAVLLFETVGPKP